MKILQASCVFRPVLKNFFALSSTNTVLMAKVEVRCFKSTWNTSASHPVFIQTRSLKKDASHIHKHQSSAKQLKKDKVPEGFELVYISPNPKLIRYAVPVFMLVLLSSCLLSVFAFYLNIKQGKLLAYAYLVPLGFLVFTWKGLKYLPARLYYNKSMNEFYSVLLRYGLRRKYLRFTPRQVEILQKNVSGNVAVQGHKMFIIDDGFLDVDAYNRFTSFAPYDKGRNVSKSDVEYLKEREQKAREMSEMACEYLAQKYKAKNKK